MRVLTIAALILSAINLNLLARAHSPATSVSDEPRPAVASSPPAAPFPPPSLLPTRLDPQVPALPQTYGFVDRLDSHPGAVDLRIDNLIRIPSLPHNDPHYAVVERLRSAATQSCTTCHVATAVGANWTKELAWPGLTFRQAGPALLDQLGLGGGTVPVVTGVAPGSAAEKGGVALNDILVTIGTAPPKGKVESDGTVRLEIPQSTKADGPKDTRLEVLRGGEKQVLFLPSQSGIGASFASKEAKPNFYVGIQLLEADAALRSQLKLGEKVGVVVGEVVADSPAKLAGLLKNDVLMEVDGTPLAGPADVTKAVQESGGAELRFHVRRKGGNRVIEVTPAPRPAGLATRPDSPQAIEVRVNPTAEPNVLPPNSPPVLYEIQLNNLPYFQLNPMLQPPLAGPAVPRASVEARSTQPDAASAQAATLGRIEAKLAAIDSEIAALKATIAGSQGGQSPKP